MNKKLLHPEVQSFIKSFKANLSDFLLRKPQFRGVTNQEIATQIQAVRIARVKIPEFSKRDDIIYPAKLHLEQSSSFLTSQFKANLLYGMKGVDLTGGFGIDTYFLGKTNYEVIYTEPNRELAAIVATNFKNLNADTIKVLDLSAELMLDQLSMQLDWFYIDPSRRNDQNTKIITFEKANLMLLIYNLNSKRNSIEA
jgi:myo-inositol-1-phosphate synthase